MVRHIVMWKMAPCDDREKRAMDIKENLEALRGKIDVIEDLEVGINFEGSSSASDVVLVATFKSVEDLNEYQSHAAHKAVGATFVRPYVSERRVCDYEF